MNEQEDDICEMGSSAALDNPYMNGLRVRLIEEANDHVTTCDIFSLMTLMKTANALFRGGEEPRKRQYQSFRMIVEDTSSEDGRGEWRRAYADGTYDTDFTQIKVGVNRLLTDEEIRQVSKALSYALRITLGGKALSAATLALRSEKATVLLYEYESATSHRAAPDFYMGFGAGSRYIAHGTPPRKITQAGLVSLAPPLIEGLGDDLSIHFYVR